MKKLCKLIALVCMLSLLLAGCGEERTLVITASGGEFSVTSAGGKSLQYADDAFSGDMTVYDQRSWDLGYQGDRQYLHLLEVPYSKSFTYQCGGTSSQRFGIVTDPAMAAGSPEYREYSVHGDGLETITLAPNGEMAATGSEGLIVAAFSLRCDALGDHGFVRFSGMIGDSASVQPDEETSRISFSGFLPGDCVLSYAGEVSSHWVTVTLEAGSGTLDLSDVANGVLTLKEDGLEAISVEV